MFCSSSSAIAPEYLELAASVGTEIGKRGHSLVSGGGALSCMGAVARAARAAGARTVGVIPAALLELELGDRDADELLVVDDMRTRKGLMDSRSDAFLTLPGGLGTLEELTEVWTAKFLGLHAKPVTVLDIDGHFAPFREQVDLMVRRGFLRQEAADAVTWVDNVPAALASIEHELAHPTWLVPTPAEVLETLEADS